MKEPIALYYLNRFLTWLGLLGASLGVIGWFVWPELNRPNWFEHEGLNTFIRLLFLIFWVFVFLVSLKRVFWRKSDTKPRRLHSQ